MVCKAKGPPQLAGMDDDYEVVRETGKLAEERERMKHAEITFLLSRDLKVPLH